MGLIISTVVVYNIILGVDILKEKRKLKNKDGKLKE